MAAAARAATSSLAAFVCGLGASNHLEMGVVAVAIAVFAIATDPRCSGEHARSRPARPPRRPGLLPYLYLPLRARAHPLLDWGHPVTPRSFASVVLRSSSGIGGGSRAPPTCRAIVADYGRSLVAESAWLGAALALVAVAAALARRRRLPVGLPLLVMAGNSRVMALHGSRSDLFIWHRYYIPSYLCAAPAGRLGMAGALRPAARARFGTPPCCRPAPRS